jgi:hypothetical protein
MPPPVHPYILYGLVLAGIPVLLHLLVKQRPKTLPFPAFRFLRVKHLRNRRKLRLQHLLLLALRVLAIAGLCLALSRPRLSGGSRAFSGERPVAAVFVFDTSPSMEYSTGGASRLDEARQRARELLDEMREGSSVAVLDTADEAGGEGPGWLSPGLALSRLAGLRVRPANGSLNRQLDTAFRMLAAPGEGEEVPPRFVYVFSDRTRACWDARAAAAPRPDGVTAVFVDVGADNPRDLAIDKIEIVPPVATPGAPMQVRVTVRATGADFDTELTCRIDGDTDAERAADKKAIQLSAGQSQVVLFERPAPVRPPGSPREMPFQVTARVATNDALPFNNVRHATFLVRERRKVLTLVEEEAKSRRDEPSQPWYTWKLALELGAFHCDVRRADRAASMTDEDLRSYSAVCLFEVLPPGPELWQRLAGYVRQGGGLLIVPGGRNWLNRTDEINQAGADLLPARLQTLFTVPRNEPAIRWADFPPEHPLTHYFNHLLRTTADLDFGRPDRYPAVYAYWTTEVARDAAVLVRLNKDKQSIALAERHVGRGRVLQLTTPLDLGELDQNRRWHDYAESSFIVVLPDRMCRYLAGDSVPPEVNFLCGQAVVVSLPPQAAAPPYTLQGPNLVLAEANLPPPGPEGRLAVPQATTPGNFTVLDGRNSQAAAFSLNVRAEESLLERVPQEEIEAVLGPGSLLQVGRSASLKKALEGLKPPPVEMLPWLMMVVLLVLTGESLLANKFYRRAPQAAEPAGAGPASRTGQAGAAPLGAPTAEGGSS